jgi:hypothetical protein
VRAALTDAELFISYNMPAKALGPLLSALQPLAVVPVKMQLDDAANAVDTILRKIEERKHGA